MEMVHLPTLQEIISSVEPDQLFDAVKENVAALVPKHIIPDDIVSSISYMLMGLCPFITSFCHWNFPPCNSISGRYSF